MSRCTNIPIYYTANTHSAPAPAVSALPAVPAEVPSTVENIIYNSTRPAPLSGGKVITVNGETGLWTNEHEVESWKGEIPLSEYPISQDPAPTVIKKTRDHCENYEQNVSIRYLNPPKPAPHGDLIIKEQPNIPTGPAPPIVIRQEPPRPSTPPTLVVREAPPPPPAPLPPKIVQISGKRIPPPPRKVVIEKLPPFPEKPQNVIIERWLPYEKQQRRIIFEKNTVPDPVVPVPKNVIVQWETPCVNITKTFTDLGVHNADPEAYVRQYGPTLKPASELPAFVQEVRPPAGIRLAAESCVSLFDHDLVGDLFALSFIDLDREGLGEYKKYLVGPHPPREVTTSSIIYDNVVPASIVTSTAPKFDATSYSYQTVPGCYTYESKL